MKRLRRLLGEERGFALVIALGVTVVLSMTVVTVIEAASSNQRNATMSGGRASAYDLAEAGVNNAMSVLRVPTNNALDKYVFCTDSGSLPTLPCKHTDTYSSGKVIWYGTLYQNAAAGTAYWDLFSTGYVRNPYGGADYQKTLRATIPVVPVTTQPLNNPSWNYIFSRAPGSGVALSGCDMTLANSVNVTAPLYVMGNLCLQNTAKISKGPLIVKGSLDLQATNNQVGAAGAQPVRLRRRRGGGDQGQRLGDDPRRDAAGRDGADRPVERLVPERQPRTVLRLRRAAGRRSAEPLLRLRQPGRRRERHGREQARLQERQPGHREPDARELVHVQDGRRRTLLGLSEQDAHHSRHDLHRRQRQDRHRRDRPLQGTGDDLHVR